MGFFDGNDVDEGVLEQFDDLPNGDYIATVSNCRVRTGANDPTCQMYAIEFEIAKGQFAGRKVFSNFCFQHSNQKAVDIGRARMKQLCVAATGSAAINNAEDLYNQPITLKIKNKINKKSGGTETAVTGISPVAKAGAAAPATVKATANISKQPMAAGRVKPIAATAVKTTEQALDEVPF